MMIQKIQKIQNNPEKNPKQAQLCLEHLLYEIHSKHLHNISAKLAQEQAVSVNTFGNSEGNWTWPVVERFLYERGYKCTKATDGDQWLIHSPTFLVKPGSPFVGFIETNKLESYVYKQEQWATTSTTIDKDTLYEQLQEGNTFAVHKMWAPLEPFYNQNTEFHITTNHSKWIRYECNPESCWRPEPVSYDKRNAAVKSFMRAHKKSPILMSSGEEMVICKPGPKGFETEPVLRYESLNIEDASQQTVDVLANKLVEHIQKQNKGWNVMAHALYTALYHLGGRITTQMISRLSEHEIEILKKYENGMYKKVSK